MPHKKWAEKYTILEEVRMKKALSLLLALVMVFALAACGQEKKDEAPAGDVEMKYMTADETVAVLEIGRAHV